MRNRRRLSRNSGGNSNDDIESVDIYYTEEDCGGEGEIL